MAKQEDLSQREDDVTPESRDESVSSTITTNRIRRTVRLSFFILMLAAGAGIAYRTLYHTYSPPSPTEVQEGEEMPVNKDGTTASVVVPTPEFLPGGRTLKNELIHSEEEVHITSEIQEGGMLENELTRPEKKVHLASEVQEERAPEGHMAKENDPS